ncbi:hypothetical protein Btru_027655 [Bulinus truncatus]|nr:hypothetical protein Btru_027655 [Bulinus truncatus]
MTSNCNEPLFGNTQDWRHRLNHGKLNKSINHKIHLYSYLRALSVRQLQQHEETTVKEGDGTTEQPGAETLAQDEDDKLPDLFLSPVILEDYTKPPQAIQEMPPLYFQPKDFFDYIHGNKWKGATSLRLVGGELLALTLAALTDLEVHRMISPHEVRANLNSRQRHLYVIVQQMTYEKMVVQLIYFDKGDMSNLPVKIVGHGDPLESPITVVVPKQILNLPYAFMKHKVGSLQLCPEENVKPKEVIARLEEELVLAKERRAAAAVASAMAGDKSYAKDAKKAGAKPAEVMRESKNNQDPGTMGLSVVSTDAVEYIADDPNLVVSEMKKSKSKPRLDTKTTSGTGVVTEVTDIVSRSAFIASSMPTPTAAESAEGSPTEMSTAHTVESISAVRSADATQSEETESLYETLNLTRNELYVAGLYESRRDNSIPCYEKLKVRSNTRAQLQIEKERQIFNELRARAKLELTKPFKHLACKRRTRRRNKEDNFKAIETEWDIFLKDHEDCEMNVFKKSIFEEGVLNRLQNYIAKAKTDEMKVETKVTKGRGDRSKAGSKKVDEDPDKTKKDENVNHLDFQFNCSGVLSPRRLPFDTSAGNSKTRLSLDNWKNGILPLLAFWRQNLDKGVELFAYEDDLRPLHFRNVYFTDNEKGTSSSLPRVNQVTRKTANARSENSDILKNLPFRSSDNLIHDGAGMQWEKPDLNAPGRVCLKNSSAIHPKLMTKHRRNKNNKNKNNNMQNEDDKPVQIEGSVVSQASVNSQIFSITSDQSKSASNVQENVTATDTDTYEERRPPPPPGSTPILEEDEGQGSEFTNDLERRNVRAQQLQPLKPSVSEQIRLHSFSCSCPECSSQESLLNDLRPDQNFEPVNGYPLVLGRLRRDFRCLAYRDFQPSKDLQERMKFSVFNRMGINDVSAQLLDMINDIVIRKEILSTSLGQTFVTVTFTRPNVILGMTSY